MSQAPVRGVLVPALHLGLVIGLLVACDRQPSELSDAYLLSAARDLSGDWSTITPQQDDNLQGGPACRAQAKGSTWLTSLSRGVSVEQVLVMFEPDEFKECIPDPGDTWDSSEFETIQSFGLGDSDAVFTSTNLSIDITIVRIHREPFVHELRFRGSLGLDEVESIATIADLKVTRAIAAGKP